MKTIEYTTPFGTIEVTKREDKIVELSGFVALYDSCIDKRSNTKDEKLKNILDGIIVDYGERIKELLIFLNTVE